MSSKAFALPKSESGRQIPETEAEPVPPKGGSSQTIPVGKVCPEKPVSKPCIIPHSETLPVKGKSKHFEFTNKCEELFSKCEKLAHLMENQQEINQHLTDTIAKLISIMPATSIPIMIGNQIENIPLVGEADLKQISDKIESISKLNPKDVQLIQLSKDYAKPLFSGLSGSKLHEFKPEYNVYLFKLKDGSMVATYGIMKNNEIVFS